MGAALSQMKDLFINANRVSLKQLLISNQVGLALLLTIAIVAMILLEFMLILCCLTLRVPALRRQGFGCSGYLWRLGGCLFFNRKETIRELEWKEAERLREDGAEKGLVGGWLKRPGVHVGQLGDGGTSQSRAREVERSPTDQSHDEQQNEEGQEDDDADSVLPPRTFFGIVGPPPPEAKVDKPKQRGTRESAATQLPAAPLVPLSALRSPASYQESPMLKDKGRKQKREVKQEEEETYPDILDAYADSPGKKMTIGQAVKGPDW